MSLYRIFFTIRELVSTTALRCRTCRENSTKLLSHTSVHIVLCILNANTTSSRRNRMRAAGSLRKVKINIKRQVRQRSLSFSHEKNCAGSSTNLVKPENLSRFISSCRKFAVVVRWTFIEGFKSRWVKTPAAAAAAAAAAVPHRARPPGNGWKGSGLSRVRW